MNTPSQPSRRKRIIMISSIILLMTATIIIWWLAFGGRNQIPAPEGSMVSSESSNTDEKDKKETQKEEKTPTDRPQTPAPEKEGAKAKVTPIVTGFNRSADGMQLLVDGGVNEIVEQGGICQFVISWSGGEASQQTEAINAPSSTSCKTARFSMDQLPANTNLTIQVSYSSAKYTGTSTNGPSVTKEQL